jgi:hypothetical protein
MPKTYQVVRKTEVTEEIVLDETEVMTMTEAAKVLGMNLPNLHVEIRLGKFTELHDPAANPRQRRRRINRPSGDPSPCQEMRTTTPTEQARVAPLSD